MTPEMIKAAAIVGIISVVVLGLIFLVVIWWSRR
jgi:hypothetical protein